MRQCYLVHNTVTRKGRWELLCVVRYLFPPSQPMVEEHQLGPPPMLQGVVPGTGNGEGRADECRQTLGPRWGHGKGATTTPSISSQPNPKPKSMFFHSSCATCPEGGGMLPLARSLALYLFLSLIHSDGVGDDHISVGRSAPSTHLWGDALQKPLRRWTQKGQEKKGGERQGEER